MDEDAPVRTEEEWTEQRRSGTTAVSPLYHSLNSVGPHAGSTHTGLEHLQADLCRPLGWIHPRPSALSDRLLTNGVSILLTNKYYST